MILLKPLKNNSFYQVRQTALLPKCQHSLQGELLMCSLFYFSAFTSQTGSSLGASGWMVPGVGARFQDALHTCDRPCESPLQVEVQGSEAV